MRNHEHIRNPNIETLNKIGYDALTEVTGRYGVGDPVIDTDYPPEIAPLAYHNADHTIRVRSATRRLAQAQGMSAYDEELAVTIASAHDLYHHGGNGEKTDEQMSADWLKTTLQQAGFSEEDQEIAQLAIIGTTPLKDTGGNLLGQQFILTQFPTNRAGDIALCVAAADMEAIFAPHGPAVAHDLFKERAGFSTCETVPDLTDLIAFQRIQIEFIGSFTPLYPELESFFGGLRSEIIRYHHALLHALQSGDITAWDEVVAADEEFYRRYAAT